MSFQKYKLKDLATISSGGTAPKEFDFSNEGIPFIRAGHLEDLLQGFDINELSKLTEDAAKRNKLKLIPKGTILFAKSGMSATKNRVYQCPSDVYVVNHLATLTPDTSKIDSKYLAYFLQWFKPNRLIIDEAYPSIRISDIGEVQLHLPAMNEQKRIVAILDKAQLLIKNRKELISKLDELVQAVFLDMFGDPLGTEQEKQPLSNVIDINPSKKEILSLPADLSVSFVKMEDVSNEGELQAFGEKLFKEVKKGYTYFKENDVLFAKITPSMENGKGAIAEGLINGIGFGSTEFHVLRTTEECDAYWLHHLLRLPHIRKICTNNMTGSAGQKRVPAECIAKLKVNVPEYDEQLKFKELVKKVVVNKRRHEESLITIEQNFQALLQRAFKGELTISA